MSSFLVNSKDMVRFGITVVARFIDRRFSLNLKLDPEDEDDDAPNTRLRVQSDLEMLYKGKIFKGEKGSAAATKKEKGKAVGFRFRCTSTLHPGRAQRRTKRNHFTAPNLR